MIGQDKLLAKLKSYTITTLPHSMLFVGELGCGKHTLVKELESHYKISAIDVTESISLEMITEIELSVASHFYVIDMTKVTERQQNIILKFLEEPPECAFIILLATSKSTLLQTVINRCMVFEFEPYSVEQLLSFLPLEENIEMLVKYCHTPGQVINMTVDGIKELITLCDNIINNVGKARFPNIFKISPKIVNDEENSYKLDIFYNVLLERLCSFFATTQNDVYKDMYNISSKALKKHLDTRLNQELIIDDLVIDLHEISRGRV